MGVALSRMRRGEASAALGFCGDGSSSGGVFHETLNLAAVWKAPLVVIVERNRFAYMTPEQQVPRGAGDRRARSRLRDPLLERRRQRRARGALARRAPRSSTPARAPAPRSSSSSPTACTATARTTTSATCRRASSRPGRCAIRSLRWHELAVEQLGWTSEDQQALEARVAGEIAAALEDALAAPYPDPDGLAASVFAE